MMNRSQPVPTHAKQILNDAVNVQETPVAAQLVGHEPHGFLSLTVQQSAEESPRCPRVPTGLYEDVDQITVLIHRAPEILALTVDRHEDFIQEPRISESTLSVSNSSSGRR